MTALTIEHHQTPYGFNEITGITVTTADGDEINLFDAVDALEALVSQVVDGVNELAVALDTATGGNTAVAGTLPNGT